MADNLTGFSFGDQPATTATAGSSGGDNLAGMTAAEKQPLPPEQPPPPQSWGQWGQDAVESALRGFGNVVTFGQAPRISALGEAMLDKTLGPEWTQRLGGTNVQSDSFGDAYNKHLAQEQARNAEMQDKQWGAHALGTAGTAFVGGPAEALLQKAFPWLFTSEGLLGSEAQKILQGVKNSPLLKRMLIGGTGGAAMGAATSQSPNFWGGFGDTMTGAAAGAAVPAGMATLSKLESMTGRVGRRIGDLGRWAGVLEPRPTAAPIAPAPAAAPVTEPVPTPPRILSPQLLPPEVRATLPPRSSPPPEPYDHPAPRMVTQPGATVGWSPGGPGRGMPPRGLSTFNLGAAADQQKRVPGPLETLLMIELAKHGIRAARHGAENVLPFVE